MTTRTFQASRRAAMVADVLGGMKILSVAHRYDVSYWTVTKAVRAHIEAHYPQIWVAIKHLGRGLRYAAVVKLINQGK